MLDNTKLLNVFERAYMNDWRKEAESEIEENKDFCLDEFINIFKEHGIDEKTIQVFIANIENKNDYIHLYIDNRLISLCLEAGMELGVDEYLRDNP